MSGGDNGDNVGVVTNRNCDDYDASYTYNDFLQPMSLYSSKELLFDRQQNIFKIAMFYQPDQSIVTKVRIISLTYNVKRDLRCHLTMLQYDLQITRDAKMSTSDKISWIGGMMGLFTGFSVISGLEIIYWLWFKVLIHKRNSVEPEPQSDKSEEDLKQKVDNIQNELQDIKVKLQREHFGDKKSAIFFDAIFNDIEAQDVSKVKKTNIE